MKSLKYCLFIFGFFIQFFYCSQAYAANKVYVLEDGAIYGLGADREFCIVADSAKWTCSVSKKYTITGLSKYLSFTFKIYTHNVEVNNEQIAMIVAKNYLYSYAKVKSSVFSSVSLKEKGKTYFVVDGVYFDNDFSGEFCLYIQPIKGTSMSYVMFVQHGPLLNDQIKNNLYQEAFGLITPLYSPK